MEKFIDPGVPLATISIDKFSILNTLIDLGVAINVMTMETLRSLNIYNIIPTPTILELADRSKVKPEGVVDDVIVSIDSWEYPVDFIILQPKSNLGGHPLILGRPWLATTDAFIGCRARPMIISKENESKQISLYPPTKSITELEHMTWLTKTDCEDEIVQPLFGISQAINEGNEEDLLDNFIYNLEEETQIDHISINPIFESSFQENCIVNSLQSLFQTIFSINSISNSHVKNIEIFLGKSLNINSDLEVSQQQNLIELLRKYSKAFAWDYTNMAGIHPNPCTHHIYMEENVRPIRQPQRRMNPMLKELVKDELQKLLKVYFIYPISDSQ